MEDQKKRILKASFGFLLVVTFLVVSGELLESYLKSVFSGNKIVTFILVVPFALYFLKKSSIVLIKTLMNHQTRKNY